MSVHPSGISGNVKLQARGAETQEPEVDQDLSEAEIRVILEQLAQPGSLLAVGLLPKVGLPHELPLRTTSTSRGEISPLWLMPRLGAWRVTMLE